MTTSIKSEITTRFLEQRKSKWKGRCWKASLPVIFSSISACLWCFSAIVGNSRTCGLIFYSQKIQRPSDRCNHMQTVLWRQGRWCIMTTDMRINQDDSEQNETFYILLEHCSTLVPGLDQGGETRQPGHAVIKPNRMRQLIISIKTFPLPSTRLGGVFVRNATSRVCRFFLCLFKIYGNEWKLRPS